MESEIRCCLCQNFVKDKIGNGDGIGRCLEYEKVPTQKMFVVLGKAIFWGGSGGRARNCDYFKSLQ
jgi:hypothetical protein